MGWAVLFDDLRHRRRGVRYLEKKSLNIRDLQHYITLR